MVSLTPMLLPGSYPALQRPRSAGKFMAMLYSCQLIDVVQMLLYFKVGREFPAVLLHES